jgi:DNA replication licensing factor MCM2
MDERDAVPNLDEDDEDGEGEDLFAQNLEEYAPFYSKIRVFFSSFLLTRDYAPNELLDRYSDGDINDDEDVEELSAAARRAAELKMARRDRLEGQRGSRAAGRRRGPGFVDDDDMDDGDEDEEMVSRMKKRTRRPYDERRDIDDLEGVEGVRLMPSNSVPTVFVSMFTHRKYRWNS